MSDEASPSEAELEKFFEKDFICWEKAVQLITLTRTDIEEGKAIERLNQMFSTDQGLDKQAREEILKLMRTLGTPAGK
ncbi:hypothetical protein IL306_014812 [Fusarium sp. DS 682]|nr:hypothetical protein IL306_014812 [Fusarium sp. DS 682]